MVRTKKQSTDDEGAAPTRRSGRARAKPVTYNDGDDEEIPPEVLEASLAEADPDVEVKPKRGRKKSATPKTPAKKGRTSRRTSKAKVEAIVEETVPEVETIKEDEPSETGSEEKQEVQTEEEVQPEQKEIQEEPNEAQEDLPDKENGTQEKSEVESKQKEDPETPHEDEASNPNPKLDSVEKDQIENKKTEDKPEETDQLPDFEEDEEEQQKQQEEPFEIINKDDVPKSDDLKSEEQKAEEEDEKTDDKKDEDDQKKSTPEEKLPDFEDPDMLQLDANIDEDMDLNKAEEPKDESKTQKEKEEEDEKKEERKRRWKSDEKETSPKRRHSIKKTDERIREPSPPPGEPMHVVHITNLVRPFTLGQLKDFLQVHGDYSDFWIDKIKSNCFVKYNEIESAINCRKLIHGKKWPSSNPKSLRVMYSTDVSFHCDHYSLTRHKKDKNCQLLLHDLL
jgi:apoptotic chromatin condensation inducer in the nucleus